MCCDNSPRHNFYRNNETVYQLMSFSWFRTADQIFDQFDFTSVMAAIDLETKDRGSQRRRFVGGSDQDHFRGGNKASRLVHKRSEMTPSQIRAFRKKLKLSRTSFGVALRYAEKSARITVWRWEMGRRRPSEQTIMLMKQLAASHQP